MVASKTPDTAEAAPAAKKATKAGKPKAKKVAARRGRPEIVVTAEQRERVEVLTGGGMGVEAIAEAMTLSLKTLKKHFANELRVGRSKRRAEVIEAMFKSAVANNVSAQKAYIALNTIAEADAAWVDSPADEARAPAPKPEKLGKKELAAAAATTAGAGTEWASDLETPPSPDALPN